MPPLKYTREFLQPIVRTSDSLASVLRTLGLPPTGGNYRSLSARIRHAEIDIAHFRKQSLAARCAAVPVNHLEQLIQQSTSYAQVLAHLGLPGEGRAYYELCARVRSLAVDTSHFRGRGWARGETAQTHESVARVRARIRRTDADVFVENSPEYKGEALTRRLRALGWTYACLWCGLTEWRGHPLVLHLDHINGIHNDNRFENLRLLCPNCHSQTETYSNRRRD